MTKNVAVTWPYKCCVGLLLNKQRACFPDKQKKNPIFILNCVNAECVWEVKRGTEKVSVIELSAYVSVR